MIVGGDEHARSQKGNNNTYCQDNALNWYDWDAIQTPESKEMIRFWSMLNKKRGNFIDHFKGKYFTDKCSRFGVPSSPRVKTDPSSNLNPSTCIS